MTTNRIDDTAARGSRTMMTTFHHLRLVTRLTPVRHTRVTEVDMCIPAGLVALGERLLDDGDGRPPGLVEPGPAAGSVKVERIPCLSLRLQLADTKEHNQQPYLHTQFLLPD